MTTEKKLYEQKLFSITIYLDNGEKEHSDWMTYEKAAEFCEKFRKEKIAFTTFKRENETTTYMDECRDRSLR